MILGPSAPSYDGTMWHPSARSIVVASLSLPVVLFLDATQELGRFLIAGLLVFQSLEMLEGRARGLEWLEGMGISVGLVCDSVMDTYGCLGIRSYDHKSEKVRLVA